MKALGCFSQALFLFSDHVAIHSGNHALRTEERTIRTDRRQGGAARPLSDQNDVCRIVQQLQKSG